TRFGLTLPQAVPDWPINPDSDEDLETVEIKTESEPREEPKLEPTDRPELEPRDGLEPELEDGPEMEPRDGTELESEDGPKPESTDGPEPGPVAEETLSAQQQIVRLKHLLDIREAESLRKIRDLSVDLKKEKQKNRDASVKIEKMEASLADVTRQKEEVETCLAKWCECLHCVDFSVSVFIGLYSCQRAGGRKAEALSSDSGVHSVQSWKTLSGTDKCWTDEDVVKVSVCQSAAITTRMLSYISHRLS
uniref:Uncharacterized protein n=1 Tax=Amphiprion percula TaxID=161767 RepID=A0A3P8S2W9_AMPPE